MGTSLGGEFGKALEVGSDQLGWGSWVENLNGLSRRCAYLVPVLVLLAQAILQEEDLRRGVRRHMLDDRNTGNQPFLTENLLTLETVADCPIEQTSLDPIVSRHFGHLYGVAELGMLELPSIQGCDIDLQELGDFPICRAELREALDLTHEVGPILGGAPARIRFYGGRFSLRLPLRRHCLTYCPVR